MDGFKEKKWFVYLGDHHEGPFSLEEIQVKLSHGQLNSTHYVWAEGMVDWKMMNEVDTFESILGPATPLADEPPPLEVLAEPSLTSLRREPAPENQGPSSSGSVAIHLEAVPALTESSLIRGLNVGSKPIFEESALVRKRRNLAAVKWIAIVAVIAGVGIAYSGGYFGKRGQDLGNSIGNAIDPLLMSIGDQVPFLGQWISPIPQLQDVDKEEYDGLKAAAKMNLEAVGPQISIALSRADLFNPSFYVASNLPSGAVFDVYVEGISETLLNQLSFAAKGQVTVNKKMGATSSIRGLDGKTFPRGQYMVYLVAPDNEPASIAPYLSRLLVTSPQFAPVTVPKDKRILASKSYFLGGLKDATYTARLKEFHDKLTAKAQAELGECKQFAATLDMQLASTSAKFASIRRGKKLTPAQKKAWIAFDQQWSQLLAQMNQSFSKLTPETLKTDYFYGSLYSASQQASQAVGNLHSIQTSLFNGTVDPRSFEIQVGESVSVAQNAVNELKEKIDAIEKLPPKPNGMPNRDGM